MIEINKNNYETEVLKSDIPVIIDFWATWCGPCRSFLPVVESVSNDNSYKDKVKIVKVNIDENEEIASQFMIRSIPTIVMIKDNTIKAVNVGALPKSELTKWIDLNLNN